jgi:hypothetical protein
MAQFAQLAQQANRSMTFSKHVREVAVKMSKQDYDTLQALKLEHLRAEVQKGLADLRAARLDLEEIWTYSAGQWGNAQADAHIDRLVLRVT